MHFPGRRVWSRIDVLGGWCITGDDGNFWILNLQCLATVKVVGETFADRHTGLLSYIFYLLRSLCPLSLLSLHLMDFLLVSVWTPSSFPFTLLSLLLVPFCHPLFQMAEGSRGLYSL